MSRGDAASLLLDCTVALREAMRGGDDEALASAATAQSRAFAEVSANAQLAPDPEELRLALGAALDDVRAELTRVEQELHGIAQARRRIAPLHGNPAPRFLSRRA